MLTGEGNRVKARFIVLCFHHRKGAKPFGHEPFESLRAVSMVEPLKAEWHAKKNDQLW